MIENLSAFPHLERLVRIVRPPRAPVAAEGDWAAVERQLGLRLPGDYKALVATYGSGMFDDFLEFLTPFSRPGETLLDFGAGTMLNTMRDNRASGIDLPYPLHPEPGGLLPWGDTANGDWCFWQSDPADQPDSWRIVVNASRSEEYWEHDGPLTAVLADVLSRRVRPDFCPDDFPSDRPEFGTIP